MSYLLDTNVCIALINGKPRSVRLKFDEAIQANEAVSISSIVVHELWYGVGKSSHRELNRERLNMFLTGPFYFLDFSSEDAEAAGTLRANLEAQGRPIGAYDTLIAAQALRGGLTLVTANQKEFSRVSGLRWVDWSVA